MVHHTKISLGKQQNDEQKPNAVIWEKAASNCFKVNPLKNVINVNPIANNNMRNSVPCGSWCAFLSLNSSTVRNLNLEAL